MSKKNEKVLELIAHHRTLVLATADGDGTPLASYAPYLWLDGAFHLYLSRLSAHTANLGRTLRASAMIIEDEMASAEIFARRRVIFQCRASIVAGESVSAEMLLDAMQHRLGDVVGTLRHLPDFTLFRLDPEAGTYVEGFGRAYTITDIPSLAIRHIDPRTDREPD